MWYYAKIKGGYARTKAESDSEMFIYAMLTSERNRSVWRKLIRVVWCKIFGHKEDSIVVMKGFHNDIGSFQVLFCKYCRVKLTILERRG